MHKTELRYIYRDQGVVNHVVFLSNTRPEESSPRLPPLSKARLVDGRPESDAYGNVYVITRKGLGIRYAASGQWENEEYKLDMVDDCNTVWGFAWGFAQKSVLLWKAAVDLDVNRVNGPRDLSYSNIIP